MGAKGTGFWGGMHVGEDGTEMPRLDLARRMIAEGHSKSAIERVMGAPTNSLIGALRSAEGKATRAKGRKPVPLQETPAAAPSDGATQRDQLEARLPVQEGSGLVPARPIPEVAVPAPVDDEQSLLPVEDLRDCEPPLEQQEHSAAGILRAFADSDACEVVSLVFEFIEYKGLESECDLFIRFGQWRAARAQQAG